MSDLSAWTGLIGVVVGVVLSAGIDAARTRRAEEKALRLDLQRAAGVIGQATEALERTREVAGANVNESAWQDLFYARGVDLRAAITLVNSTGNVDLMVAADKIRRAASAPNPDPSDERAVLERFNAVMVEQAAFIMKLETARLRPESLPWYRRHWIRWTRRRL